MRFAVYTLRRTSSRTVYAIYDTQESQMVTNDDGQPVTTTDRALAASWARLREKEAKDSAGDRVDC